MHWLFIPESVLWAYIFGDKMTNDKKLPYFPLYPRDFLGDTGRLGAEKFGVYVRLLFNSWIEPLHDDIEELAEASRADTEVTSHILNRYFSLENGAWVNHRLENERTKAQALHDKRVASGKKGAEVRYGDSGASSEASSPAIAVQNTEDIIHKIEPREENTELFVVSLFSEYPLLNFPDLTIPRMLEIVYSMYGVKAVRYMLDQISKVKDVKKRYAPAYIKAIIDNAPLLKIKEGKVDRSGFAPKEFTRDEALAWADKNGVRMDESFETRGESFEDGKPKFYLKVKK